MKLVEKDSMDENKTKALQAALAQIEKQFGKGSIMRMDSDAVTDIEVVSTGSLGGQIMDANGAVVPGAAVECKEETEPLGTAGAILHHLPSISTELVLAGNGDSLVRFSFAEMLAALDRDATGPV